MADLRLPRLNRVLIAGRVTQELELKFTPKGTPVVRFTVALDKRFKDESDQWQSQSIFVDVVGWNNTAENICKQAHKGSAVLVEGRIDARSYVDNNNINRKVFEIVADNIQPLEWKPKAEGEAGDDAVPMPEEHPQPTSTATADDVPF